MLNNLKSFTQHIDDKNDFFERWLQTREKLLVSYYKLVGLIPCKKEPIIRLDHQALEDFCLQLVDYLSSGHFYLYDKVIKAVANSEKSKSAIATHLHPQLQANTDSLMAFHDQYASKEFDEDRCLLFQRALSDVSEQLEARFALEDKLIQCATDQPPC